MTRKFSIYNTVRGLMDSTKIAQDIYDWMRNLEGEWVVHKNSFLPANVLCDYAGKARLIKELSNIIDRHLTSSLSGRAKCCDSPEIAWNNTHTKSVCIFCGAKTPAA